MTQSIFDNDPTEIPASQRLAQAHAAMDNGNGNGNGIDHSNPSDEEADIPKAANGISKKTQANKNVDFSDEAAFPTLGGTSTTKPKSLWGSARPVKVAQSTASQVVNSAELVTETIKLEASQQQARSIGKSSTGEIVKSVQRSTETTIQMSTASKTGTTTFLIRGKPEGVAAARRSLMKELGKKVRHGFACLTLG